MKLVFHCDNKIYDFSSTASATGLDDSKAYVFSPHRLSKCWGSLFDAIFKNDDREWRLYNSFTDDFTIRLKQNYLFLKYPMYPVMRF